MRPPNTARNEDYRKPSQAHAAALARLRQHRRQHMPSRDSRRRQRARLGEPSLQTPHPRRTKPQVRNLFASQPHPYPRATASNPATATVASARTISRSRDKTPRSTRTSAAPAPLRRPLPHHRPTQGLQLHRPRKLRRRLRLHTLARSWHPHAVPCSYDSRISRAHCASTVTKRSTSSGVF